MSFSQDGGPEKKPTLEWMYKPSALVDREDYLLGRTVDKSLKILEEAEKGNLSTFNYADEVEKDLTPLSIFASQGSGPIDVIKKIKEDPLYQIQKKEEESLKQLLKNPVRMKQLEQHVKDRQRLAKKSKKSKKSSKMKKSKRRKRDSSNSSSSSSESDEDNSAAAQAFKNIDKLLSAKLHSLKSKRRKSSSSSSSDSERREPRRRDDDNSRHRSHASSSRSHSDHGRSRSREHSDRNSTRHEDRRDQDRERRDNDGFTRPYERSRPPATGNSSTKSKVSLKEEELEKKRREMMDNAKWRDEQRTKTVNKYRSEEQKEKEDLETNRDPDFIRKQLLKAAASGSVEKRIKSNSYNIQRSKFAMDQNFAKR